MANKSTSSLPTSSSHHSPSLSAADVGSLSSSSASSYPSPTSYHSPSVNSTLLELELEGGGSRAYRTFINAIKSPATQSAYTFFLKKYMQYYSIKNVDDLLIDKHDPVNIQKYGFCSHYSYAILKILLWANPINPPLLQIGRIIIDTMLYNNFAYQNIA